MTVPSPLCLAPVRASEVDGGQVEAVRALERDERDCDAANVTAAHALLVSVAGKGAAKQPTKATVKQPTAADATASLAADAATKATIRKALKRTGVKVTA